MRLIINGKAAASPELRAAVLQLRDQGHVLEPRVTWEGGDAARYAQEALHDGVEVLVAGGGDGTINEVVNGVLAADSFPDKVPLNLDGEPHCWDHISFKVAPRCLPLVLPEDCPLIARGAKAQ